MPTKRRKLGARAIGIDPAAIEAWRAGDYWALHRALRLRVWQMPDWRCDPPDDGPRPLSGHYAPDPTALKRALVELAGPPPKRWFFRSHGEPMEPA
jgi:hypothetical protein